MTGATGGPERPRDEGAARSEVARGTIVVAAAPRRARGYWGLPFAVGVVAVIFGIMVLANLWASLRLVTIFAGLVLVFAGLVQAIGAPGGARRAGRTGAGLLAVAAGLLLVFWPEASVKTVAVLVGLAFLLSGVAIAGAAFGGRGEGWGVISGLGLLLAVIGVVVLVWPGPTIAFLMVLVGLNAIIFGVAAIAQGLALRSS